MSTTTAAPPRFRTVGELLESLGVPASRVRLVPAPGTATERDLLKPDGKLCELIDGVMVEKPMGAVESMLAMELGALLLAFVKRNRLGIVLGSDGIVRLMPGLVRIPDIAYTSRARLPKKGAPREPIPDLAPDLAVEVLSKSNTKAEMKRKLRDYFAAGVRLVWLIDPKTRSATVHTSPAASARLDSGGSLDGSDVLPGFALPLAELFESLDRGRDD